MALGAAALCGGWHAASADAAACSGSQCSNQDPYATGCNVGDSIAGSAAIVDANGAPIGQLKLYWSSACQSNWGQAYFDDGNPASTPPVTITVVGSSSASGYDTGPVSFTTTASGSPVWGNLVYSPGCAYATVSRGGAKAVAIQVGCPAPGQTGPPPPTLTLPARPPPSKCSGDACTGQDPYVTGCNRDASVAGSGPITASGRSLGTLILYYSASCQTNWGQASFNDGNPSNTAPVDLSVIGTRPLAAHSYDSPLVPFTTTGSGSPVWGNMVYSPGCAYATVRRGDALGQAVQRGCPAAGSEPVVAPSDQIVASGWTPATTYSGKLNGTFASFTDSNSSLRPAELTATIDWGDGTQTPGHVFGGHPFYVNSSHSYPAPPQGVRSAKGYQVTVTIRDVNGATATAQSAVEVIGVDDPTPVTQGQSDAVSPFWKGLGIVADALGTVVDGGFCGAGLIGEIPSVGTDTPATVGACVGAAAAATGEASAIHDPPDLRYRTVFMATSIRMPNIRKHCGRIRRPLCPRLHDAVVSYVRAYLAAATLAEDIGVTANRFGAAAAAHNRRAGRLQRHAEAAYLARWRGALRERQTAGRALARLLVSNGLDRRVTAAAGAAGRLKLINLNRVSRSTVAALKREGLIAGRAGLATAFKQASDWAPPPADAMLSYLLAQ